ncbi:MAG TPA: hypothetical protein VEA41_09160 [Salinarimonas sp.]|nr:hypothetical protein [Salinarimonas sp.]
METKTTNGEQVTWEITAGQYDSILEINHALRHPTVDSALAAFARVSGSDATKLVCVSADDGNHYDAQYVYYSQEDADEDLDGGRAAAVIRQVDEQD